ncbi:MULTISPECIES: ABC transporter permease subunit [unclassified Rhizobium]|jgi:polar amino acid transport system permease protein|uniref:ABC transporter permease n=1 Tax=unclassified Rhizobium TaxID=2613769 RepID=UPI00068EF4A9|nr:MULTISPECIES: ABC transporter permease subunit [unclassified Rhizobium]OJY65574.1 MAG: ABC transporter permease [Rhizobium sp. 60-20]RKD35772.1 amino acid ABC transporter membrane protein 1 (PAAT family) [Rhizobium sp. WW_1]
MIILGADIGAWSGQLLAGALVSVALAVATVPFGMAVGVAVALAKDSSNRVLSAFGEGYTTVFRGLPELLTLLLVYYGLQMAFQITAEWLGLSVTVNINPFVAGILALSLVFGAYSSEVLLGGLRGIERGQIEAAISVGMTPLTAFVRIKWPQVLRLALPGLGNNWVVLLKDTSLVSVIALNDLLRQTSLAVASTKEPFAFYAVACLGYLLMTIVSNMLLMLLEARANRGWRPMSP